MENNITSALHEKLQFVARTFVIGRLFAIPYNQTYYPALILDEHGYRVYGNVYVAKDNFSDDDLKILDEYEEYYPQNLAKSEYIRQVIQVNTGEDRVEAVAYLYNQDIPTNAIEMLDGNFINPN